MICLKESVFKKDKSLGKVHAKEYILLARSLYMLLAFIRKIKQANACWRLTIQTLNQTWKNLYHRVQLDMQKRVPKTKVRFRSQITG